MHSPHLLAQMSHFLMSLREQHQKLRLVQEQQANISNSKSHATTDSDHERESNRSTSTTPLTSPGSQQQNNKQISPIQKVMPLPIPIMKGNQTDPPVPPHLQVQEVNNKTTQQNL